MLHVEASKDLIQNFEMQISRNVCQINSAASSSRKDRRTRSFCRKKVTGNIKGIGASIVITSKAGGEAVFLHLWNLPLTK